MLAKWYDVTGASNTNSRPERCSSDPSVVLLNVHVVTIANGANVSESIMPALKSS